MSLKRKSVLVRDGGPSEEAEQCALIEWADLARVPRGAMAGRKIGEFLFSIPNGAYLSGSPRQRGMQMSRLKKQGLRPGVSDLFLSLPASARHGLYIEMKRPGPGRTSNAQIDFAAKMMQAGYLAALCRGFSYAKAAIESYLDNKGIPAEMQFPIDWKAVVDQQAASE